MLTGGEYINRWSYGPCDGPSDAQTCYVAVGPGLCGGIYFYDALEAMRFCNQRFFNPGDFNRDGRTDSQDFFDFLACFYSGTGSFEWYRCEWNNDGAIDTGDFFAFMADFQGTSRP